MFAVRNGCFKLAAFLRSHGADVNALCSRGYMWSSTTKHTQLLILLRNNRAPSLSRLSFLLEPESCATGTPTVNVVVQPELNHTAFHAIAMLKGDSLDSDTATKALDKYDEYFMPNPVSLNMKSCPRLHHHALPSNTDVKSVVDQGGNTALHYAAIYTQILKQLITCLRMELIQQLRTRWA
jgi:ankyrin repeat protein